MFIQVWSILIDRAGCFLEKRAKVLGSLVDTYKKGMVLSFSKLLHSPCEIAFICCSMTYALYRKELITEYRDSKDVCTTYKGK